MIRRLLPSWFTPPAAPGSELVTLSLASRWRKAFLVSTVVLVCLYAVSVLYYARSIPDIGLHTAFSNIVNRVDRDQIRPIGPLVPEKRDVIVGINDRETDTWPDLLRELARITPLPDEEVQVHLKRPATGEVFSAWCRVDRSPLEALLPSVLWFCLKFGLFLVGVLVFWNRPNDRSAAQFFVLSAVTVGAYMGGYQWWRIATHPLLLIVFMVCAVLLPAVTLHFYLIFPRPKQFLQRWPGWTATMLATYGVPLFFLGALLLGYGRARWLFQGDHDPDAIDAALQAQLLRIYVYLCVAALWYLGCIVCLGHSFVAAADLTERNQVKWILFGSLAALVPIAYSLYLAIWAPDDFGSGAATWPMFAASACFTAAFTISITRYRLMELDQIIGSGLGYFVVSCLAGLAYYGVVFLGMLLVGTQVFAGPSLPAALAVSTTALVLAVVRDLARDRFKKVLDRRFRREKHHLDQTLQQMGQTLERLVDPPALARRLLQASAELLGVPNGFVFLREGDPPIYRLAEALGTEPPLTELASGCPLVDTLQGRSALILRSSPSGADAAKGQLRFLGGEVAQALVHEGQLLALLVLGPKDSGPYKADDLNLLAAFAQIAALALANAERHRTIDSLNRDLQTKVEKISEQQRRILALQSQLTKQSVIRETMTGLEPVSSDGASMESGSRNKEDWIVGSGLPMRQLLQLVRKVAPSPSAVLLRGESGTGKELLARALHENSLRAGKAFVTVHSAALAPGLLESELFGHVKGAFTGAHRDKPGRFELANGGTLFLDEIGDISLDVQTKLLRVLQEKTFERVGSTEPIQVDVRILAATHQDLESLIRQGRFREDLFYRINGITVEVPALRERREDIPELALHFLRLYAQRAGKALSQIDDDAMIALKSYAWPGNVRQLEHVIERAVVLAEGATVTEAELPPEVLAAVEAELVVAAASTTKALSPRQGVRLEREERDQRERERLVRALAAAAGNKAEAARALGLARSTLLSRLKKYGLS